MSDLADLNVESPVVKGLAEKYQVPPTVIAYIRAAIMGGKYTKDTLIMHITEENLERKKEIQQLKLSITEENVDQRREQIQAIQKKMDFRQGSLAVLRTVDDAHLREILKPE